MMFKRKEKKQEIDKAETKVISSKEQSNITVEENSINEKTTTVIETPQMEYSEMWTKIALAAEILKPVYASLSSSISKNLSSTTEPLSLELLKIRTNISDFLKQVSVYEDEVKDHAAINKISSEGANIVNGFDSINENIKSVFDGMTKHIEDLKSVSDKISSVAKNIAEVSEQIRILSFNASIEAARAGKAGAGFRVIAGEIKNLSFSTESYLEEIYKTLGATQDIFNSVQAEMSTKRLSMREVLLARKENLSSYFSTLKIYVESFETLYNGVNSIISQFSNSMVKISPVIQLHEITSQEIDNLGFTILDFLKSIKECYNSDPRADKSQTINNSNPNFDKIADEIVHEIRKRLTTERELKALENGITKSGSTIKIDLGMNNLDIELF